MTDANRLVALPGSRGTQKVSAGPFARPPVTRFVELETAPRACASEGGLSGSALRLYLPMIIAIGLALSGCSHGVQLTARPAPTPIKAVLVYPVALRWSEPAWRGHELTARALEHLVNGSSDALEYFGPDEFKVNKPEDDHAWLTTDALKLVTKAGYGPAEVAALRVWIEKFEGTTSNEAEDLKGRSAGSARDLNTLFRLHAEVFHPSTAEQFIEATIDAVADPFSPESQLASEFDPTPEVSWKLETLLTRVMNELKAVAVERKAAPFPWTVAETPAETLEARADGEPSLMMQAAKQDMVTREVTLTARARYAVRSAAGAEISRLLTLPEGVIVTATEKGARLRTGDVITRIDDAPATLARLARTRFKAIPTTLKVLRVNGSVEEIMIP